MVTINCFWLDSNTSGDYSDWTADAGINLQPSTPLSSRKRVRRRLSTSEEEEEDNEEEEEKQQSDDEEEPGKKSKEKTKKEKNKSPRVSSWTQRQLTQTLILLHLTAIILSLCES